MKSTMLAVVCACALTGIAEDKPIDGLTVAEYARDMMVQMENQEAVLKAEEQIVEEFFGEDSKSSFIVRKELTATQKRFMKMAKRFYELCAYVQNLENRIKWLEADKTRYNGFTTISVNKDDKTDTERKETLKKVLDGFSERIKEKESK